MEQERAHMGEHMKIPHVLLFSGLGLLGTVSEKRLSLPDL